MVDYKVSELKSNTVSFLSVFERDFNEFLIKTLKNDNFKNISISKSIILDYRKKDDVDDSYYYKTNASFSLANSYTLQEEISNYLKKRSKEFDSCIQSNHLLRIDLLFESKQEESRVISNSEKENENTFYIPIEPKYKLTNVILPEETKNEIREALNVISLRHLIYDEWGFGEIDPYPRSILNFYGPAGTGKTMTAHAIANELGKKILAVNYAEIESKYIGEAPKNLMRAFESAKKYDAVLFFDEADSFLGKRIQNVTHGSDQALNSLRSQMLILLENFNGIVIFATNLVSNFDSAFESRILKHIKFELPNLEARKSIIMNLIPKQLPIDSPLSDDQLIVLAEITEGLSGRELKNAMLETLLHKASECREQAYFSFNDFKSGFERKIESIKRLDAAKVSDQEKKILNAISKLPKEKVYKKKKR